MVLSDLVLEGVDGELTPNEEKYMGMDRECLVLPDYIRGMLEDEKQRHAEKGKGKAPLVEPKEDLEEDEDPDEEMEEDEEPEEEEEEEEPQGLPEGGKLPAPAHPSYIQPVFQLEDSPLLMTYLEGQESILDYYVRVKTRCNDWSFSQLGDARFRDPLMVSHCILNGLPNVQPWLRVKEDFDELVYMDEDGNLVPNEEDWKIDGHCIFNNYNLRSDLQKAAARVVQQEDAMEEEHHEEEQMEDEELAKDQEEEDQETGADQEGEEEEMGEHQEEEAEEEDEDHEEEAKDVDLNYEDEEFQLINEEGEVEQEGDDEPEEIEVDPIEIEHMFGSDDE